LSATVNAFDILTPNANLSETSSASEGVAGYDEFGNGVPTTNYNTQLAGVRRDLQSAQRSAIFGAANGPDLRAGYAFSVTDNSGSGLGGSYLVTSVHHSGFVRVTNGVSTFFYGNQFSAIPSTLNFRPSITIPKPTALPCYATISAPAGQEINVDSYGRVKVLFSWDHRNSNNGQSSAWVPLASPWAGQNRGMIFLPRDGDEVVVSFIEGDPDQPIVTGSLYTGIATPPFALPSNKTQSGILTQSSPGSGYNELMFEDKPGSEQIYIHAQRDLNMAVLNNKTETITGTRTETVGSGASLNVTGTYSISAGAVSVSGPSIHYGPTSISNTFTVAAGQTGGFNSAVALVQNLDTTSNSAPALRVLAQGSPVFGAFSVSTGGPVSSSNTNPIASFGNANVWVSYLDNNGNWYTRGNFYGTTLVNLSDRNAKENFTDISPLDVLDKVVALPLSRWNYKTDKSANHIGPMAQDFYAAFHLGQDDKHIATVDEEGVTLAAVQGLNQKIQEREKTIQSQESRIRDQAAEIADLKARLTRVEQWIAAKNGDVP
jgi:phage baseplate assembly protein gpV